MSLTLGAKLTAWSALFVGVALLICGIGAALFIQHEQFEGLDQELTNEAHIFFRSLERLESRRAADRREDVKAVLPVTRAERFIQVLAEDGLPIYSSRSVRGNGLPPLTPGMHTLKIGNDHVRLGVFNERGLTLFLGAQLNEINADSSQLMLVFSIGLPLLVATVAGGGWLVARKALTPVREITAAAERITAERLNRRLPALRSHDEIGRLTEVLNAMLDRLEKGYHQAMRFSADASHELKTPLTVLRAGIEDLLETSTLTETDERAVSALLEQTRRLSSITQSLLLLSRADAGRLTLDLRETDAREIIGACVEDAHIIAERRHIKIGPDLGDELPALLDAGRFSQILLNLLDNAVKYNRDGGRIAVTARWVDRNIIVKVANTGAGIPAEHATKLFERFYRFDPQPGTVGHGLGLSLARELARAHGGDLVLTSSDAKWTVFTLHVLASRVKETTPDRPSPALEPAGHSH
ncbi:MAG TPA: ATP-binding protein [Chthoniobacteraceae bacterium]|jgi:signal transduction histidine kinase|nr:ATP-binding protein [Chthoniobacteraceae bacterium]